MFGDLHQITCSKCKMPTWVQDSRIDKCIECYRKSEQDREEEWDDDPLGE